MSVRPTLAYFIKVAKRDGLQPPERMLDIKGITTDLNGLLGRANASDYLLEQMNIAQGITYPVLSRVLAPKQAALIALGKASDYSVNFSSAHLLRSYLAERDRGVQGSIDVLSSYFGIPSSVVANIVRNLIAAKVVAARLPEICNIYLSLPRNESSADHVRLFDAAAFDPNEAAALMARVAHNSRTRSTRYDLIPLPGTRQASAATLSIGSEELVYRLQLETNIVSGTFYAGGYPFGIRSAGVGLQDAKFAGTFIGHTEGGVPQTRACLGVAIQDGLLNSSMSLSVGGKRFGTYLSGKYMMLIPDGPYFCVLLFELPVIGLSRLSGVLSPIMAGPLSYMVQYLAGAGKAILLDSKAAIRQWVSSYHQPAWTAIDVASWLGQLYLASKLQDVAMDGIIGHYTGKKQLVSLGLYGMWEGEQSSISVVVPTSALLHAYCATLAIYLHLVTYGRMPMPDEDATDRLEPTDKLKADLSKLVFNGDPVATYATGVPTDDYDALPLFLEGNVFGRILTLSGRAKMFTHVMKLL